MSLYCATGSIDTDLSAKELNDLLRESLAKLGDRHRVLAVPPDQSREHSRAGELTGYVYDYYGDRSKRFFPRSAPTPPCGPTNWSTCFPPFPKICSAYITGAPMLRRWRSPCRIYPRAV